jgi:hypothetical protein
MDWLSELKKVLYTAKDKQTRTPSGKLKYSINCIVVLLKMLTPIKWKNKVAISSVKDAVGKINRLAE